MYGCWFQLLTTWQSNFRHWRCSAEYLKRWVTTTSALYACKRIPVQSRAHLARLGDEKRYAQTGGKAEEAGKANTSVYVDAANKKKPAQERNWNKPHERYVIRKQGRRRRKNFLQKKNKELCKRHMQRGNQKKSYEFSGSKNRKQHQHSTHIPQAQ